MRALINLPFRIQGNISGTSDDYTTEFSNTMKFLGKKYMIALDNLEHMYSWNNIDVAFGNNTFSYFNGLVNRNVVIPNGQYSVQQLNDAIHYQMRIFGDFTLIAGKYTYDIELEGVFSTQHTRITLTGGYTIDFTVGAFRVILGFNAGVYFTLYNDSQNIANFEHDVTSLTLRLPGMISNSIEAGNTSNAIYSWSITVPPGHQQKIIVNDKIWLPINVFDISNIRVQFVDQNGLAINFNGGPTRVALVIQQIHEPSAAIKAYA